MKKIWTPAEMGKKGGKARKKSLTAEERSEIARKGGAATKGIKKKKKGGS